MKLFAASLIVVKVDENKVLNIPGYWMGTDIKSAETMLMTALLTKYPVPEFEHHCVAVTEIPRNDIKRVAVATGIIKLAVRKK